MNAHQKYPGQNTKMDSQLDGKEILVLLIKSAFLRTQDEISKIQHDLRSLSYEDLIDKTAKEIHVRQEIERLYLLPRRKTGGKQKSSETIFHEKLTQIAIAALHLQSLKGGRKVTKRRIDDFCDDLICTLHAGFSKELDRIGSPEDDVTNRELAKYNKALKGEENEYHALVKFQE